MKWEQAYGMGIGTWSGNRNMEWNRNMEYGMKQKYRKIWNGSMEYRIRIKIWNGNWNMKWEFEDGMGFGV